MMIRLRSPIYFVKSLIVNAHDFPERARAPVFLNDLTFSRPGRLNSGRKGAIIIELPSSGSYSVRGGGRKRNTWAVNSAGGGPLNLPFTIFHLRA